MKIVIQTYYYFIHYYVPSTVTRVQDAQAIKYGVRSLKGAAHTLLRSDGRARFFLATADVGRNDTQPGTWEQRKS